MNPDLPRETAVGFLADRHDWLHVYAAPAANGDPRCTDIVLRLDGSYTINADAMVEHFTDWLNTILATEGLPPMDWATQMRWLKEQP